MIEQIPICNANIKDVVNRLTLDCTRWQTNFIETHKHKMERLFSFMWDAVMIDFIWVRIDNIDMNNESPFNQKVLDFLATTPEPMQFLLESSLCEDLKLTDEDYFWFVNDGLNQNIDEYIAIVNLKRNNA